MARNGLKALCGKWKRRLGLSHWDITVRFSEPDELEEWVDGRVLHKQCQEQALILIKRPEECQPLEGRTQDVEQTIVHELLHVVFGLSPELSTVLEEKVFDRSLDRVARLLVALERGEGKRAS